MIYSQILGENNFAQKEATVGFCIDIGFKNKQKNSNSSWLDKLTSKNK